MNNQPSIVRVENIRADDLFDWFYLSMWKDSGDGFATLVCENYLEVAEWFEEWIKNKYPWGSEWLPNKEIFNQHEVVYVKGEESLLFTDRLPVDGMSGNYIFIVYGDCYLDKNKTIKAIPEVVNVIQY